MIGVIYDVHNSYMLDYFGFEGVDCEIHKGIRMRKTARIILFG